DDSTGLEPLDDGLEAGGDRALLDPVLEVRPDPVLEGPLHVLATVDDRHVGARAVQVERGVRGAGAAAHYHHRPAEVRVRLGVVVRDLFHVLARHVQDVRVVEVARRDDHRPGRYRAGEAGGRGRLGSYREARVASAVRPIELSHAGDAAERPRVEALVGDDLAVVIERLFASGLGRRRDQ